MSRLVSLNARHASDAPVSGDVEVVLIEITHPLLPKPIRLSTDNGERISIDPILYGTRSTWRGADPVSEPYLWIMVSAIVPGDTEDAPAAAQLVLECLDAEPVELLRSFTDPATANIAVVMADTPDFVEQEWLGLQLTTAESDGNSISISLSRDEIEQEPFPSGRMTRYKFPGLHL